MLPARLSAARLREIAERRGLDEKQFSQVTGLSRNEARRYLSRDVTASPHIVTRLLDTLHVTPEILFENPDVALAWKLMAEGEARLRRQNLGEVIQ